MAEHDLVDIAGADTGVIERLPRHPDDQRFDGLVVVFAKWRMGPTDDAGGHAMLQVRLYYLTWGVRTYLAMGPPAGLSHAATRAQMALHCTGKRHGRRHRRRYAHHRARRDLGSHRAQPRGETTGPARQCLGDRR